MSKRGRQRVDAPAMASKDDFSDFKTKVYDRTKQRILGDLENLRNGKHPGFTEKVVGFRKDREMTLKHIATWHASEKERIGMEYDSTCERLQVESQDQLKNLEEQIRQDFEACKADLLEERQAADAQSELIRDVAKPHISLRPQNSRKRPRRHPLDMDGDGESDSTPASSKPGGKKARGKKIVKDTQPAQRLSRDAGMLSDNEIDSDIRFFNRPKHPGNRGRRPPKTNSRGSSR